MIEPSAAFSRFAFQRCDFEEIVARGALNSEHQEGETHVAFYRVPLLHRLDRYPRSASTSQSIRPASGLSTRERKTARSAPEVVAARLRAVLVVASVVASIAVLTSFGDQGSASASVLAGVVGMFSAVLGLVFGFGKAYQSS